MYCARHPDTPASRRCERCQTLHCDICIRPVRAGRVSIESCAHCDGILKPVAIQTVAAPSEQLRELVVRIFSINGIITALALALPAWLSFLPLIGRVLWIIYVAGVASYYFKIVDHVG